MEIRTDAGITGWGYNAGIGPALKAPKAPIDEAIAPHPTEIEPEAMERYAVR
jgi:L-alanine-DL-glutamate epimerase-like enolase superfamily enzyme